MTLFVALLLCLPAGETDALELTLDDAIQLARTNNLTLQTARLDVQSAIHAFDASWGAFDTVFFANATYSRGDTAPTPSTIIGGIEVGGSPATDVEFANWRTGFTGTFLTGTTWTFDVGPQKVETETVDFSSSVYTGDWGLELSHPVLRNGADDYARSALERARHDANIAALAAEGMANQTLEVVTAAYWNLMFARADLRTRELSVELASELLDITRRKFEQGLQNRINVTEVEAELAARREELLRARTTEENAQDELRRLVLAPENEAEWSRELVLTTRPAPATEEALDLQAALQLAMVYRPDVAEAREQLARAEVDVRRAINQQRPRFDVTGGYGANANNTSYGEVYADLDGTEYHEKHVRLDFELPIGNRTAGYEVRRSQVARQRAGVVLKDTEMTAYSEVRTAVREVQLQTERVSATAETARLQQEVYDGETRRLENDLSTPFLVRQAQRDLLSAIDAETRAKLDLEIARTRLLAAEGRLLYVYGMERSIPELSLTEPPPAP
ncbi:MAG: TolC family protein [Planctomycetota bacterium]|jgi:outer membrane protein TolC